MASDVERLLKLKEEVEAAKLDKAKVEGSLDQNLKQLKEKFKCSSEEKGQQALKDLREEREEVKEKISTIVQELEDKYEW